jgi:hypothetical protein
VVMTGGLSYLKTLERLAQSDVLVVVEAACEEGIFLPSKVVDYAQVGRPILALSPRCGTIVDLIGTYGGGIAVDHQSSDDIGHAMGTMYSLWKEHTLTDRLGSSRLYALFSPDRIVEQYALLFASLSKKRG